MKELGIGTMWMASKGYRWTGKASIRDEYEECFRDYSEMAELAEKYGVTVTVHNHSGDCLEQDVSMLAELIHRVDSPRFGINWDPAHAVVEGFLSGWKQSLELCGDKLYMLSAKDYRFARVPKRKPYKRPWEHEIAPVGEGTVPWDEVFDRLKVLGFKGPISFHNEYEHLVLPELFEQAERDLINLTPLIEGL